MPTRRWIVVFVPLALSMSCRSLLDYGAVTFEDTNVEPGDSGPGGDGSKPDVVTSKGGGGGTGGTGSGGTGGISTGGTSNGGAAGEGTGGSSATGGSSGNGGTAGTGGGSPANCNNGVCESGEDCSSCPADCVCGADTTCVFASPPGAWTCICTGSGFCAPGTCKADRCNCTGSDGGTQVCDPGKACASGGCAP